ncbi:MAG: hypothetical protein ACOX0U_09905 [Oscillospiraceae bacterium]|jgi:hypothetical protein
MDRSRDVFDGAPVTQRVEQEAERFVPYGMAFKDAALPVEPETGLSCPIIRVTVTLEGGAVSVESPPHFFTTEIAPGGAITIQTCPETNVTELYLPPGFHRVENKIAMPDYLISAQTFWMICKVGKTEPEDICAFPIVIRGVWKGESSG